MGSRIMHLIIADQVAEKMNIKDKQLFLLGGIAPDAAPTRERKNKSHFYEGSTEDGSRFANYRRFTRQHPSATGDEYALGYLVHLISDDVWMKQIYFKNNLKNRVDADPGLLDRWHADFRQLNGILIEQFQCGGLKTELQRAEIPQRKLAGIEPEDLNRFAQETIGDFAYHKDDLTKELQVYSLQQILDYIDAAARQAIEVCASIKR